MYETGKLAQVTAEKRRYNLHLLGVSKSRWIGTGRLKTVSGETVLYSGRDDEPHREGVAIILKKGADRSLLEWKPRPTNYSTKTELRIYQLRVVNSSLRLGMLANDGARSFKTSIFPHS